MRAARTSWARIRPPKDQTNFEGWLVARFGWRLYRTFFKTYTEKVWGVPVSEMPADWAAQRIKNLSLGKAVVNALLPEAEPEGDHLAHRGVPVPEVRARDDVGASAATRSRPQGSKVVMETASSRRSDHDDGRAVVGHRRDRRRAARRTRATTSSRRCRSARCCGRWTRRRRPTCSPRPTTSRYRDFLTVALVVPDDVRASPTTGSTSTRPRCSVGRIQNFGSWSPYMVKDGRTCLGLEYFVYEGDELWSMADDDLVELGTRELAHARPRRRRRRSRRATSCACRRRTRSTTSTTRPTSTCCASWLERARAQRAPGRPQRHAQVQQPGPLDVHGDADASRTSSATHHDVWAVNVEEEYHEETSHSAGTGRSAPVTG